MNNKPTPETDAFAKTMYSSGVDSHHDGREALKHAKRLERERDEARKELSSIHRWIERNHADGFIDSLTYLQNLERATDSWYDRINAIETDARRFVRERDEAREEWGKTSMDAAQLLSEKTKVMEERDEAREQVKELREALLRVRTWGVSSKNFSATDSCQMAEWIDDGCEGELPKPNGPWIYEKMEEAK